MWDQSVEALNCKAVTLRICFVDSVCDWSLLVTGAWSNIGGLNKIEYFV